MLKQLPPSGHNSLNAEKRKQIPLAMGQALLHTSVQVEFENGDRDTLLESASSKVQKTDPYQHLDEPISLSDPTKDKQRNKW